MLLLEKYIKKAVKKALKEQEEQARKQHKSVYLIYKFPGLKEAMVDLMSPAFPKFISDIKVVAPKPTTFNVSLTNGMDFYLSYVSKGKYIAKVQGKKYNLINLGETQRAGQAIANMLELSFNPTEETPTKSPAPPSTTGGSGAPGAFPGEQQPSGDSGLEADLANLELTPDEEPIEEPTPEL